MCQRERKREREREFNNENNKCKSESEFIEKSYIRARACPRKHTLPVVIHAICVSDFLPFRGQIFFPRVTVNTDHSSLPRASFFHAHFKIKREKSKRERERERSRRNSLSSWGAVSRPSSGIEMATTPRINSSDILNEGIRRPLVNATRDEKWTDGFVSINTEDTERRCLRNTCLE